MTNLCTEGTAHSSLSPAHSSTENCFSRTSSSLRVMPPSFGNRNSITDTIPKRIRAPAPKQSSYLCLYTLLCVALAPHTTCQASLGSTVKTHNTLQSANASTRHDFRITLSAPNINTPWALYPAQTSPYRHDRSCLAAGAYAQRPGCCCTPKTSGLNLGPALEQAREAEPSLAGEAEAGERLD